MARQKLEHYMLYLVIKSRLLIKMREREMTSRDLEVNDAVLLYW